MKIEYTDSIKEPFWDNLPKMKTRGEDFDKNCLHKSCPACGGTGIKKSGGVCIHGISCPCRTCSPWD